MHKCALNTYDQQCTCQGLNVEIYVIKVEAALTSWPSLRLVDINQKKSWLSNKVDRSLQPLVHVYVASL